MKQVGPESWKVFPWRIFTRIVLFQAILVLVAVGASGVAARYFYKNQFIRQLEGKLKDTLTILNRELPKGADPEWCRRVTEGTSLRVTLMGLDGRVHCDSTARAEDMENHLNRPEVEQAIRIGFGASMRYSKVSKMEMYYSAMVNSSRGWVVRAAGPLSDYYVAVGVFDTSLGVVLASLALLLGLLAIWSGQKLVFPLGRLLLKTQRVLTRSTEALTSEEVVTDSYGEWSELESNIDDIRKDLEAKARTLDAERVELATIMGAISDAILAVDPEGIPLFYNTRFRILFGGGRLSQAGTRLWELFRDPDVLGAFTAALKDGIVGVTKTFSDEQEGAGRRFFSLSVSPLRQEGAIYGAVGIFHDVTELKMVEQMRIDFVANVSHELRTPLTSIKGYAETLIDDLDKSRPVARDFLTTIMRNSNRLMNLMEDLLDLSSIESDHILQRDCLNTDEITRRILKQLEADFAAKRQKVDCVAEAPTVVADAERLEQVLVNLLSNANKYTPEDGKITVRWERSDSDVLLKVSDTGPGIPLESQPRVFERFYRVDKARSREQGGTGLGLAIVKHIMQRHGGSASVTSRPGEGATFICRFPS